jgi:hypothetical protein
MPIQLAVGRLVYRDIVVGETHLRSRQGSGTERHVRRYTAHDGRGAATTVDGAAAAPAIFSASTERRHCCCSKMLQTRLGAGKQEGQPGLRDERARDRRHAERKADVQIAVVPTFRRSSAASARPFAGLERSARQDGLQRDGGVVHDQNGLLEQGSG